MPRLIDEKERIAYGIALDHRCAEKRIKKQKIADIVGINRTLMSMYTKEFRLPNVIIGYKICKALDWTVEEWHEAAMQIMRKEKP